MNLKERLKRVEGAAKRLAGTAAGAVTLLGGTEYEMLIPESVYPRVMELCAQIYGDQPGRQEDEPEAAR